MMRREFLAGTIWSAATSYLFGKAIESSDAPVENNEAEIRRYLRSIMPTRERIEQFTHKWSPQESEQFANGWTFDADLGWVHCQSIRNDGINGSRAFYRYEDDGARQVVNCRGTSCRVHAYGNSFTHCDQVNDSETWPEYLAAHLQEPIRNYGVGGYSVYQAYRRMLKVEKQVPAEYIVLNIWDDDHFRNLDAWRSIRVGSRSACGFTLPHLRVDLEGQRCEQVDNLLRTPAMVAKLRDEGFLFGTFSSDPILQLVLAAQGGRTADSQSAEDAAVTFGIPKEMFSDTDVAKQLEKIHLEAALFATKNVVRWTEEFVAGTNRKLMLVLSFGRSKIRHRLEGRPRFDQNFVDWLADKPYPVVDLREIYFREFQNYRRDARTFLREYFNGHHTPTGNFLMAKGLRDAFIQWLNPAPRTYQGVTNLPKSD